MSLSDALTAHQAGNMPEAERLYRAFLEQEPRHADACALLGVAVGARGDFRQAIEWVDKAVALDPASGLLHFHRGTVLMAARLLPEAIAAFACAVELQPDVPQIHFNFANALRSADDWQGAIAHYRAAVRLDPRFLSAFNNLSLSLVHEKQYEEAFHLAKHATELDPAYGDGWLTLCNVAEKLQDYDTALAAGERAIALIPDNHYAWFGYGVALNRVNRDAEAVEAYTRALQLNPARADIWDNLAQSYQSLNRLDEAEQTFCKTVEVAGQSIEGDGQREIEESEYGNRHWHLALIELLRGKYAAGFARYRARISAIGELKRPQLPCPLWKGEDLRGKTILVCDEQGFGDTLMLARFLPALRQRGARIVFRVHKSLKPLFEAEAGRHEEISEPHEKSDAKGFPPPLWGRVRACPVLDTGVGVIVPQESSFIIKDCSCGTATPTLTLPHRGGGDSLSSDSLISLQNFTRDIVIAHGEEIPACDYFCSSFDLPHRLGATLETLPSKVPYLPVLPPDEATLLPKDSRPKIGVVWGGSPLHRADGKRSVPLALLADLFSVPNVAFYSFNRDLKPGDAERLPQYPIENLAPRLTDFAVAARLIGQMDLVITCDTATAHLAGGLGKKTWVMLPFAPDWRWLTGRDDSPWYPTARLFRQSRPEDWQGVVEAVRAAGNTI